MHEHVTIAQASLRDPRTCPEMIDYVLQQCLIHSRPVYIQVPADMVDAHVASDRLTSAVSIPQSVPSKDEDAALKYVLNRVYESTSPMLLVDGEVRAYGIVEEVEKFSEMSGWPIYTSVFGKSLINETSPNFCGIWKGNSASEEDQKFVKGCDLILCFGPHLSTTNSYFGSSRPNPETTVFIKQNSVEANGKVFQDLPAQYFIKLLLQQLESSRIAKAAKDVKPLTNGHAQPSTRMPPEGLLTQTDFYHKLASILRSGDVVLGETGTAGIGVRDFPLPKHVRLYCPATWLSIGYMLPAAQGAAIAQRELYEAKKWSIDQEEPGRGPRTILLIGDGSLQMTVQELSTMIRENLNVLVIVFNNNGYTIERCIHGWDKAYNDIARWNYLQAPSFFGAPDANTTSIRNWGELDKAMSAEIEQNYANLRMWEVFMPTMDAPSVLMALPGALEAKKASAKLVNI